MPRAILDENVNVSLRIAALLVALGYDVLMKTAIPTGQDHIDSESAPLVELKQEEK